MHNCVRFGFFKNESSLCAVFNFITARDGDVEPASESPLIPVNPILFEAPEGSATKVCNPVCTACTSVEIMNDFIIEEKFESFSLSLSHSDPAVSLSSQNITVTIEDEDSESSCQQR